MCAVCLRDREEDVKRLPVRIKTRMTDLGKWLEIRFRRQTTSGMFIPEIDGLRFVAIAAVVAFHLHVQLLRYYGVRLSGMLARPLGNGDRGVSLFFVISGFILALPFASHWLGKGPRIDLRRYFQRRLTRLEPPYILNLVVCAVFLVFINHEPGATVLPHLLASLFYSHNLLFGSRSAINAVTWSLEVEVQFYLAMPLFAYAFAIRNPLARRTLVVAAMLIAGISQAFWAHTPRPELSILYYVQFFLAGLLLADFYLTRPREPAQKWWWDVLSAVGWPLVFFLKNGDVLHTILPFVVLALYWAAFHGRMMNYLFRLPVLTSVGGMCYTIYLYHFLTIAFATRVLGHSAGAVTMVGVSIGLIATVSSLAFLFVERPCMDRNWPRKLAAFTLRPRKGAAIVRISTVRDSYWFGKALSEPRQRASPEPQGGCQSPRL
jgi:peptidoglycan/LPS O-acetylase OafA/YrhL